ncbi:MAG: hypothetical protein D8H93_24520 [Capnocytophaga sp.]|nr:MAG: hypothetical protein D8H93_24520 [Capnocytophaga sp.]
MKNNDYTSWLVSLEIAQQLKEIGFKEKCLCYWHEYFHRIECSTDDEERLCPEYYDYNTDESTTSLPTHEQVFEWFREKGLYSFLRVNIPDLSVSYFIYDKDGYIEENGHRSAYEDAKNDCVKELIKIYKEHERKE